MLTEYINADIYQDDLCILKGANLKVDEGEFIYIIGKVGSGKSSLLKTIYCELDIVSADKAVVMGRDLMKIRRKEVPALRKEMGIIFQDFKLLPDRNVYKNLNFVLRSTGWKDKTKIKERIDFVMHAVGMQGKELRMPHELSGGEQQRIAIARALLNNPKMIVADEPTGNLDPETADNIVKLLKDISTHGTSVVMSTHNIPMLNKVPGVVYRCENQQIKEVTEEYR